MDRLQDLPVDENVTYTPQEKNVMEQLFGPEPQEEPESAPKKPGLNWKVIGSLVLAFVALVNPLTDKLLSKMGNRYIGYIVQLTVFFVVMIAVMMFL